MAEPAVLSQERGRRDVSLSGLTEAEAKEFHTIFMTSFIGFVAVALVAHILVWMWRPWLPGPRGYGTSMIDGAGSAFAALQQLFT
ncbi:light-harvesting antenna LH1, beta subunit [Salinarimonas soli]|uniref:Light-harvesting protein n=1 Tax=Salinarimonas soli TaxID=1638099 RepID=A0A5B2VG21_9HYPH|nr:light-harvesting antenna LH1, beta subunit [Salinarimonas soli]KAA2238071.1 light-harvesting protein [Salinarimonas soli]